MSNRLLKQEEIDALLNPAELEPSNLEAAGAGSLEQFLNEEAAGLETPGEQIPVDEGGAEIHEESPMTEVVSLKDEEKDALGEVGNICMGSAATTLSMLLNQTVNITSPRVTIITLEDLFKSFDIPHMTIHVSFIEGLSGYNLLIMKLNDAAVMADLMMGGDGANVTEELTEIGISAASEAMNQMIGSASTSMAAMFGRTVNISPPETKVYKSSEEINPSELGEGGPVVVVWFNMTIGSILDTQIMQVMSMDTAKEEAGLILGQLMPAREEQLPDQEEDPAQEQSDGMKETRAEDLNDTFVDSLVQDLFEQGPEPPAAAKELSASPAVGRQEQAAPVGARPPVTERTVTAAPGIDQRRLDLILDIPLKISVLLGRTKWPIKDILGLSPGATVELQSIVDEPVEVLVNGTLVAMGEVVVVNENFGVRITNIINPAERLQHLRK